MNSEATSRKSLQQTILRLFAVVLVLMSILVAGITLNSAYQHSRKQLLEHFETSQQVFVYKLINDSNALSGVLANAAKNFNIKQLIADGSNDPESLLAAMANLKNRGDADFSMVTDGSGNIIVSSGPAFTSVDPTRYHNRTVALVFNDGTAYLVTAEPVRFLEQQPNPDAWLLMGQQLDRLLGDQIRSLTGFGVSVFHQQKFLLSTEAGMAEDISSLPAAGKGMLEQGNTKLIAYRFKAAEDSEIDFLFTISRGAAFLNFLALMGQLILILVVAILLAVVTSFYIARGVTQPLRMLVAVAQKIREGDYDSDIPPTNSSEVHELSNAITAMQDGIEQREKKIERLAYYDTLTGLPNRNAFFGRLQEQLRVNEDEACAVILIDLDRFTEVNDTLGHDFGDKLLCEVAKRISNLQFKGTFAASVGGDQTAILLTDLDTLPLQRAVDQFDGFFETPFEVDGVMLDIDASFGVSVYPDHADNANGMIQCADIALNKCKESHAHYVIYEESLNTHSVRKLSLMSELRYAIEADQLSLYYQPKLCIETGKIVSVECLVRWIHPEHGFIGPDDFIPLAERSGAIRELTKWAIKTAIDRHREWAAQGISLRMAINISAIDLVDMVLPAYVAEQLSLADMEASCLTLEVTESAVMDDPAQAIRSLDMLHRMGVKLSIDDFGTGFSSMAQLKQMPVQELKIDKSFVQELATNSDDEKIVKSTVDLAHNLGLSVVAEGVEDEVALAKLGQFGVEFAQGYFISRPLPAADFFDWIQKSEYKP